MSRRTKRYERRQIKRQKQKEKYKTFDNFNNVCSLESLYKAANKSSKGVRWKASTQRILINILFKIHQLRQDLITGKDVRKGFICFKINERGKIRDIKSVHFTERIVQKALCINVLYPTFTRNLIHENSASQKDKGTLFATNTLTKHLRRYYRKYGNKGYILTIDFKKYFENIEHKPLIDYINETFNDRNLANLTISFIKAFGDKGLGLGSETSQINAIMYPNSIDHYIKSKDKFYGRYMDDSYIISQDKEFLKELLEELRPMYKGLGILLNPKKTQIISLNRGFKFLKTRFILADTGKVVKRPCRSCVTLERRKLKKQIKLYNQGLLTNKDMKQSFDSWVGSMLHRHSRRTVYEMTKLYNKGINERKER